MDHDIVARVPVGVGAERRGRRLPASQLVGRRLEARERGDDEWRAVEGGDGIEKEPSVLRNVCLEEVEAGSLAFDAPRSILRADEVCGAALDECAGGGRDPPVVGDELVSCDQAQRALRVEGVPEPHVPRAGRRERDGVGLLDREGIVPEAGCDRQYRRR